MCPAAKPIESVAILGAGHCGRQVAFLMARVGLRVICLEPNVERLSVTRNDFESQFGRDLRLDWSSDLSLVSDVDLLWESVPESLSLKREALRPLLQVCTEQTILASNSSYLAPSMIFRGFPNPERFAGLHFHVPPWFASAVDVMPATRTSEIVLERLTHMVDRMQLTPIILKREYPGYVFNNLLHPLLVRSMELVERGVCRPEDVERAWRAVTRMPVGPFGMMLEIGLPTMRQILDNAVQHIGDQSSIRAHRFMQGWDGNLDRKECEQIVAPELAAEPIRSQASHGVPLALPQRRFCVYQLEWDSSDADLLPNVKFEDLLRNCERVEMVSARSDFGSVASDCTNWLWSDFQTGDDDRDGRRGDDGLSDAVMKLIHRIKGVHDESSSGMQSVDESNPERFLIACRDRRKPRPQDWPGLSGLARSVWLEDIARQWSSGSESLADRRTINDSYPIRYIEVDAQSARLACATRDRPQVTPASMNALKTSAGDKEALARQLLHVHQRFERGSWRVQRLRQLSWDRNLVGQGSRSFSDLVRGTRWLVSGGGRGITFHLAKLLGEHGARLELLGRTPMPRKAWYERDAEEIQFIRKELLREGAIHKRSLPAIAASFDSEVELSRNLKLLHDLKIEAYYHQVDVTNRTELDGAIHNIEMQRGGIDGVLHGAGYEQTTLLTKKSEESIRKTIESKVTGAVNLEAAVDSQTRWFIVLGSLAGYFGGIGQVDYAGANGLVGEMAMQSHNSWSNIQCLTIGWPGWEEVGMAARASSQWALQRAGHSLISIQEGVAHFRDLIESRVSGYVLICNPEELPKAFLKKETEGNEPI